MAPGASADAATGPSRNPLRRAALAVLALFGWRTVMVWPPEPRCVIIFYPHTSNWDFVIAMLFRFGWALPAHWVGKRQMFRWPFRRLLAYVGGIPVDRDAPGALMKSLLQQFREREQLFLTIAPEGTRSRRDHVRSGFYRIALTADVPVALGCVDYGTRTVGIHGHLRLTGDEQADLARLREFYADKRGRRPGLTSELRFK